MGKKKQVAEEDLIIPKQDNRICGTICVCQMTLVLSCVAIVYLTVAIYVPANNIFNAGVLPDPAMCVTTRSVQKDLCNWTSCSEWCLSKVIQSSKFKKIIFTLRVIFQGSGACQQIMVNLRYNGSQITFNNCSSSLNKTCYSESTKNYTCLSDPPGIGPPCRNLSGLFNCSRGVCHNITDAFECQYRQTDPPLKCSGRRGKVTCMDIHGLHVCDKGSCERIRANYQCERRCNDIVTHNKNIILMNGDNVSIINFNKLLLN